MEKLLTVEEEVQEMLANSLTTAEALKEIKELNLPNLDNNPEFMADVAKGQIVEDILVAMETENINKSDLAARLDKSRQYISRVLNEKANFTIKSLAEIACALNLKIEARIIGKEEHLFLSDAYLPIEKGKKSLNKIFHEKVNHFSIPSDNTYKKSTGEFIESTKRGKENEKLKFAS
ncbi:MAG: helix-turn-helix transcriptional regulator [Verrucomicrobiota bacterium]|nr:helix-turn-helix transcriptional regulator [Verrucomicrobiota bacterium]